MEFNQSSPQFEKFTSEQELEAFLLEAARNQYADLFGQTIRWENPWFYHRNDANAVLEASPTVDHSKTNTQESGVDEGDLIKTNGEYLYIVDNGQTVTVVDVRDPLNPTTVSQVELQGAYIQELYLHEDGRATVISTSWSTPSFLKVSNAYHYSEPTVNVTVLDVSSPNQVQVLETTQIEGSLLETRAIGDQVYVVTQSNFGLPEPESETRIIEQPPGEKPIVKPDPIVLEADDIIRPGTSISAETTGSGNAGSITINSTQITLDEEPVVVTAPETSGNAANISLIASDIFYPWPSQTTEITYETEAEYLARVEGQVLSLALPDYSVIDGNGQVIQTGLLTPATEIYKPLDKGASQLTNVSVFNPLDSVGGPSFSTSLPHDDWFSALYMTPESLYLAAPQWDWEAQTEATQLLKFSLLDDNTVQLAAQGEVPGYLLNQFSLDEHQGYLRVATTDSWTSPENNVYVLEQEGQTLTLAGQIENLAPGERIYSARFEGDLGYVVTFRQVDPLFVFDLSDPNNPQVVGELKVPGFSDYLQIIELEGERHLLGIGRDADPETGLVGTLKVSLFDVDNLAQPTEVGSYLFPEEYAWSLATWEHHAVSYYSEWQALAIPFQTSTTQGLRVFGLDAQVGITHLGDISHETPIERSLRIGEYLVSLSDTQLTLHQFTSEGLILAGESALEGYNSDWLVETYLGGTDLAIAVQTLSETNDSPVLMGKSGDDLLKGTRQDDMIKGKAGDDTLMGGQGDDTLRGGKGDDLIKGMAGDDTLRGGRGQDTLLGGQGDDVLIGIDTKQESQLNGFASDTLTGGQGNDLFVLGDRKQMFYDESNIVFIQPQDPGEPPLTYALITDFTSKDKIQLKGGLDYNLEEITLASGVSGLGIFVESASYELIGIIQGKQLLADLTIQQGDKLTFITS